MVPSSLRYFNNHEAPHLPQMWSSSMSAEAYQHILADKRRYIHQRALELRRQIPRPPSFWKMVVEVIRTRREMNRITWSQYL